MGVFLYDVYVKKYEILSFPEFIEPRGSLIPLEFEGLPFVPQRAYLVTSNNGAPRGGHAHIVEEEIFFVPHGKVTVVVNDGSGDTEIFLDTKKKGVHVKTGCWHELKNFSPGAVVLALSSTTYLPGESNYMTDKEVFLKERNSE